MGISSPTLSFPGSGLVTSDRRVALGFGWTTFTDLQVSTGNRLLLGGGLGGHSLDQRVGHYYLRTDLDDQSARLIVSNDTFVGGTTDWWETMSVQMIASVDYKGSTLELAAGVRALTDPIVVETGREWEADPATHRSGARRAQRLLRDPQSRGQCDAAVPAVDQPRFRWSPRRSISASTNLAFSSYRT